jgi:hypothetical protein
MQAGHPHLPLPGIVNPAAQHRAAALGSCRKMAVAGSGLLLSGWRLAVTVRTGARHAARQTILFFDSPADAPQMPPEGV